MFSLFVSDPVSEVETNLFFEMLTKENNQATRGKEKKFLIDDKLRTTLFQEIFCNSQVFDGTKMNYKGFDCFKKLFLIVN